MKQLQTFIVVTLAMAISTSPQIVRTASCFCPTNAGHVGICDDALQDARLERTFGSRTYTFSKSAITQIGLADASVDAPNFLGGHYSDAVFHFTDEKFFLASSRLLLGKKAVVELLRKDVPDGFSARWLLGQLLHTLQDFYAHSNWIEKGQSGVYSSLGRTVVLAPGGSDPCPSNSAIASGGGRLSTAYYTPGCVVPAGTCAHGSDSGCLLQFLPILGGLPLPTGCPGIHKDHSGKGGFSSARLVATEASIDFISQILQEIAGNEKATAALMDSYTLGFVVDDTGSMGSSIAAVKLGITSLVRLLSVSDLTRPPEFLLQTFNDPTIGTPYLTTDPAALISRVNAISPHDGDDCPELAMAGLLRAINEASPNSVLFLVTDADARDAQNASSVYSLAAEKNITIYSARTGSCGFGSAATRGGSPNGAAGNTRGERSDGLSSSSRWTDAVLANSPNELSSLGPFDLVSLGTGGRSFRVSASEVENLFSLLSVYITAGASPVVLESGVLAGGTKAIVVPLNSTASSCVFSLSASNTSVLGVRRPNGDPVQATDGDVQWDSFLGGVIIRVTSPATGNWLMEFAGTGPYAADAIVVSTVNFEAFEYFEIGETNGHAGAFRVSGQPLVGVTQKCRARVGGQVNSPQFQCIGLDGTILSTINMGPFPGDPVGSYAGEMIPPNQPYRVAMVDSSTRRIFRQMFVPQDFRVVPITMPANIKAGRQDTIVVELRNLGATRTFDFSVATDIDFPALIEPESIVVPAGGSALVSCILNPPQIISASGSLDVILTGVVSGSPQCASSSNLRFEILGNLPPDCSGAYVTGISASQQTNLLEPIGFAGITDPEGEPVTVYVVSVTQDEPLETNTGRDANLTCPDAWAAGDQASLRNESSPSGDGRVYDINFLAVDLGGATCEGHVTYCIPRRGGGRVTTCVNSGDRYNSFGPCERFNLSLEPGPEVLGTGTVFSLDRVSPLEWRVKFGTRSAGQVSVRVHDVTGRLVSTVVDAVLDQGIHEARIGASNWRVGMYFVRVASPTGVEVRRILVGP